MKGKRASKPKIREATDANAYHIKQDQDLMAAVGYVPDLSKHGEYVRVKHGDRLWYEVFEGKMIGPFKAKCADGTLELLCHEKTARTLEFFCEGQPPDLSRLRKLAPEMEQVWLRLSSF